MAPQLLRLERAGGEWRPPVRDFEAVARFDPQRGSSREPFLFSFQERWR